MKKTRRNIPINTKRQLIVEAGNKCSMTNCTHETGLEIHHIDENPSNNDINNLILLCAVHHAQATKGILDKKICELLKANLKEKSSPVQLSSRNELVKFAINYLNNSNNSYRNITVGPLFLSPEWYMTKRDERKTIPNFDNELFEFVKSNSSKRNHDIRIIFSLSSRYVAKINEIVRKNDRENFINGLLSNINLIFGEEFQKGPDILCCHTGYSNIDMIFDEALISTYRPNQEIPTSSGLLYLNQQSIDNARSRFDNIFDNNSEGQKKELFKLITFVENLWKI